MTTLKTRLFTCAVAAAFVALELSGCARNSAPALVASAKAAMAQADYSSAAIQLKNALQIAPADAEARFLLAKLLLETGDPGAAEIEVRKALELHYPNDEAYPLLARALLAEGKYNSVISEMRDRKLDSAQGRTEMGTSLAFAYLALGDANAARKSIDAALAGLPADPRGLTVKAQIAAALNELPEASKLADAALLLAPEDVDASVLKAQLELAANRREQAMAILQRAVAGNVPAVNARVMLVSLLLKSGQTEKAKAQVDLLNKLAPKKFGTIYSDALVSLTRGDLARARDLVQELLAAKPDHLPSLYLSGVINYRLGSYAIAMEALRKVVAQAPNFMSARRDLALTYLRVGRANQAVETLKPALERSPEDAMLLRTAGEVYAATGDLTTAAQYFGRASAIDKGDTASKIRLAEARFTLGDSARALSDLESIAAADPNQYQADLALITAHLYQGNFAQALAAAATLEKKQPDSPYPYNIKGMIYVGMRDLKNARANFEKALELQPNNFTAAHDLALLDAQDGNPEEARKRYAKILEKDPKNAYILLALAELLATTGQSSDEVKGTIERAIAADPTSVAPRLALVGYYIRMQDPKAALTAAKAAQAAFPDDVQTVEALGSAQLRAGETTQALETYRQLVRLQPEDPVAMTRLAGAQAAVKDYDGAIASLRVVLANHPNNAEAWAGLLQSYMLSGRPERAIAEAQNLQKKDPGHAAGFALEGELLFAQGRWKDSAAAYRAAIVRQPLPIFAIRRYTALQNSGNTAEAKAMAETWIKDHPEDATMLIALGEQSELRKDYRDAAARYRAALEVEPDNIRVMNNLAWALIQLADPKATEIAERAYLRFPNQANVIDTYGWALVKAGDANKGLDLLKAASGLAPQNGEIRLHLATALAKTGDKAGARRELDSLTKLDNAAIRADAAKLLGTL